ncbi:MAG: type I-E CRISPR-associated protein Cse1/CasA, partial [Acidobacteriota bacterium]
RADDLPRCCGPCAAVALFNQAVNSPSFGGGFKGTLRGGAPLTTLVAVSDSRQTAWLNVLCEDRLPILADSAREEPVWIKPLERGATVQASGIGWKRGLLWQPARIELQWSDQPGRCPACGETTQPLVTGFITEKFNYTLKGNWPHPHGPRKWKKSGNTVKEYFDSFTTTAPSWTHLTEMLVAIEEEKEGNTPAAVVRQYRDLCRAQPLQLMVGGYRNNQATIEERRHERISLSRGWQDNLPHLRQMIELALEVKDALRRKSGGFGKEIGAPGLPFRAQALYYQQSESIVHETLRRIDWREYAAFRASFVRQLAETARRVFDQLTAPYSHSLQMIQALVKARRGLDEALRKLIREASEAST